MNLHRTLWVAAVAAVVLAGAVRPTAAADEKTAALAHIKLSGSLSEAPVSDDPLFGATAENFKSKLDRIRKAQNDSSVNALYLQIDGLSIGWGKVNELRQAIAACRKAGKKVFAYADSLATNADLMTALACDEVCVAESGWVMLTGMAAEVTFYKDLFEKIGVQADMLQMGDFKGAAEPYTRSSMSKEFRAQYESVINDYFEHSLVAEIVAARKKLSADDVKRLIDNGPYTARAAQQAGLIDRVAYSDDYQKELKTPLQADKVKLVRNYGQAKPEDLKLSNPFDLLKLFTPPTPSISTRVKIAVIHADGVITTGKGGDSLFGGATCGSDTMLKAIRQAEQDRTVKAIVLRVDSPGGSALASDLIWNELRQCKKPVVASMSDTAASGGYYISMAARKIYAEPGTLTGSIGVVGGKITMGGLEEKIGLHTEVIRRGANATIFSLSSPFSDSERRAMTTLMRDTYEQFLTKALEGRKRAGKEMTRERLEKELAGGRIWTGRQALAHGLIDALGTLGDAVEDAKKMAGLDPDDKPELLQLPKPRTLLDTLLEMKSDTEAPDVLLKLSSVNRLPGVAAKVRAALPLLRLQGDPVWVVLPYQVEVK